MKFITKIAGKKVNGKWNGRYKYFTKEIALLPLTPMLGMIVHDGKIRYRIANIVVTTDGGVAIHVEIISRSIAEKMLTDSGWIELATKS